MNILFVDNNELMRNVIAAMIVDSGHRPVCADGHCQALECLSKENIDLVIMDIEMPEVNGFELTKRIRTQYPEWIPIIFLSTNKSDSYLEKGIDSGGDDYLTKPVNQVLLSAKLKAMERIVKMKGELERANRKLEMLNSLDPLTQVLNRRGLEESLEKIWQTHQR